jgi:hypothetical protein
MPLPYPKNQPVFNAPLKTIKIDGEMLCPIRTKLLK